MSVSKKISVCVLLITAALFLSAETHVVAKGETFYSISRSYGITVDELLKANNLEQGAVLKAGQKLTIPGEETSVASSVSTEEYTVSKGDTLYSIARKNGTTVDEIRSLNGFTEATVLKVGQVLKLPSGSTASKTTAVQTVTTTTITATATASSSSSSAGASITLSTQEDPRTYEAGKKGDTSLVWPVKASEVVYITGKISGVALTAAKNEAVNAIHKGTVMFSGVYRGFGKVVFVQDDKGYIYVYAGLDSVSVSKGDDVAYGTKIGVTGTDALSGKSQINLMVYDNGKIIDPAKAPRG